MSKKPDNIEFPTEAKWNTGDHKERYDKIPNIHVEMTQEDGRISTYGKAYDNESIVKETVFSSL